MARLHVVRLPLAAGPADAASLVRPAAGRTLWLAPTAEAAGELRAAVGRAAAGLVAPHVFDLQGFADAVVRAADPAARPLLPHHRRLLLDAASADDGTEGRGLADAADGLLTECKRAGLDLKAVGRGRRGGTDRLADAAKLAAAFERKRQAVGRLAPEDRLARAAELWAAGRRGAFAGVRAVVVAGFVTLAAVERRLIDAVMRSAEGTWLTLPDGPGRDELFTLPRVLAEAVARPPGGDLFAAVGAEPVEVVEGSARPADPRPADPRPAGLRHLADALFADPPTPAADAAGLHRIEAAGSVGEARLVARRVRELLAGGAAAGSVVVTARHVDRGLDVLREVLDEYGVPHHGPAARGAAAAAGLEASPTPAAAEPLARSPAVSLLLRAWRLPDDDFPFAAVAALLRSAYFRPPWEAVAADPDLPMRAEALLRQLGEPRGREAYLEAVRVWSESPPLPLEDEGADEPRRKRVGRLAVRCRAFLGQFFRLWDRVPRSAPPGEFAARLRRFAGDIGLSADRLDPADAAALATFWAELDRWTRTDGPAAGGRRSVPRAAFARLCASLAASCPQPAPPPATDAVRIRIPDEAAVLDCDHLFVIGLGEGSFPDLSGPPSALDDADRDRLRAGGAELPSPDDRLAAEMLLFARLVARPRRTLTLSRPAVDPHGQPLLPSSFLVAAEACFAPDAIPTTRQRMPIDGYAEGPAFAAAEHRVQTARSLAARPADRDPWASADDLTDNLRAAKRTADARFRGRAFGPFDGLLRHPPLVREVADRFGPAKVFSPTALEAYVACPFRFWLEHVLRLEPLEDPGEEVEHTRRGAAVHRALARFHKRIRDEAPHLLAGDALPAELGPQLEADLLAAVQEYADRAPGRTAKVLWELEGRRLLRSVRRYRGHWDGFRGPWRKDGACPTPHAFESNFGVPGEPGAETPNPLVISVGGVEVRIGGVIDRIDAAEVAGEVGFWIIDYKTGRGEHYTGRDLEQFEKLQLPLYAIAVERVLFAGRPARPLGLAYWLVAGDGPKPVLPDRRRERAWLADPAGWAAFRSQLEAWVATIVSHIRSGDFPLAPRSETCTDTCSFGPVCRISQARAVGKVFPIGLPVVANPAA